MRWPLDARLLTAIRMTDGLQQSFPLSQSPILIPLALEGDTGAGPPWIRKASNQHIRRGEEVAHRRGRLSRRRPRRVNAGDYRGVGFGRCRLTAWKETWVDNQPWDRRAREGHSHA
jgi:hypothetical protein